MRRLSLGIIAAAFLGGAAVQLAVFDLRPALAQPAAPADVIRARQIILTDSAGRERIRLEAPDSGTVGVVVLDTAGKPAAELGILTETDRGVRVNDGVYETYHGGGMGIVSLDGKLRFGLGFTAEGNGGMTFRDEQGRECVSIGMPPRGEYSVRIKNKAGEDVFVAP